MGVGFSAFLANRCCSAALAARWFSSGGSAKRTRTGGGKPRRAALSTLLALLIPHGLVSEPWGRHGVPSYDYNARP